MELIALLFPAVIATMMFLNKVRVEHIIYCGITVYVWFTILINIFTMYTVTYVMGMEDLGSESLKSFSFFMAYTLISLGFSLMFSVTAIILRKNLKVFQKES